MDNEQIAEIQGNEDVNQVSRMDGIIASMDLVPLRIGGGGNSRQRVGAITSSIRDVVASSSCFEDASDDQIIRVVDYLLKDEDGVFQENADQLRSRLRLPGGVANLTGSLRPEGRDLLALRL